MGGFQSEPLNPVRCPSTVHVRLAAQLLNAATKSLAIECGGKAVRVNAVALGVVKTAMHGPETHEVLAKLHPGRAIEIRSRNKHGNFPLD